MGIPQKPNKRRNHKTRYVMTPEEQARHFSILRLQRNDQALALRTQLVKTMGEDILNKVPTLLHDLTHWIEYGGMKDGNIHIEGLNRTIRWQLHDNITKYPELWCGHFSE